LATPLNNAHDDITLLDHTNRDDAHLERISRLLE
jgi:hypothetical protein